MNDDDLHHLRSILRQLREVRGMIQTDARRRAIFAENIGWLDCFIANRYFPRRLLAAENTCFSSLLPQTVAAQMFDDQTRIVRREKVQVRPLDAFFDEFRDRNVFLKIDTQGFEHQVLEGAPRTLSILKGIQLEVPIVQLYENSWGLPEISSYLGNRWFALSQIRPVAYRGDDPVSLLEVDCIFGAVNDQISSTPWHAR